MAEQASDAEHTEMLQLIQDPANELDAKRTLLHAYQTSTNLCDLSPEKQEQILTAVLQSDKEDIAQTVKLKLFSLKNLAVAAVLLICTSIGFYFLKPVSSRSDRKIAQQEDVLPGRKQTTLTLADGSVISLSEANKGKIATETGLVITKQADGKLVYEVLDHGRGPISGFNTIATPYGGKYEITLQDGTRVILNSGSKITYPLSFAKENRTVILTGEAYFEVAKEMNRPFIVHTPSINGISGQDVRVLGTHFNINAYPDEQAFITTLLEGSVKIETENTIEGRLLKPGQQATIKQSIVVSSANVDAAIAWTNDLFDFTDLPLKDMMRKLARWYDIEVVYQGEVAPIGFWAQISKNKKLSEVLASIETTNSIHFKIEGKKVIVSQKKIE